MIEQQLIEQVVYNFINNKLTGNVTSPTELVTKLNDELKTFLRVKAEAKFIQGEAESITYFVSYKDSMKNSNTLYFQV